MGSYSALASTFKNPYHPKAVALSLNELYHFPHLRQPSLSWTRPEYTGTPYLRSLLRLSKSSCACCRMREYISEVVGKLGFFQFYYYGLMGFGECLIHGRKRMCHKKGHGRSYLPTRLTGREYVIPSYFTQSSLQLAQVSIVNTTAYV
jgi:hypothetical protein